MFGIDVLAEPFDKVRGFQTYWRRNCEVLLLRLENLDEVGPAALRDFLELPSTPTFVRSNTRLESEYGDVYEKVMNAIQLDPQFCEQVYSDAQIRHFYSDELIDQFIHRWTGRKVAAAVLSH